MAVREFEELSLYRGTLGGTYAEIVASQIDLVAVRRIRVVNRSKVSKGSVDMYVVQGENTSEADGQLIFNAVEIEPNGFVEWHGWHILSREPVSGLFESVYARANGQLDCFIDGALMEVS